MTERTPTDLERIASTIENLPEVLEVMLATVDAGVLTTRPQPGEWSPHEVILHVITSDRLAFSDRIEAIVGGAAEIAGFDPTTAMAGRDANAMTLDELLTELRSVRAASAAFVRTLTAADLERTGVYRDGLTFVAGDFVNEWPFHDADHLQQILDAVKSSYVPSMSASMRAALGVDSVTR